MKNISLIILIALVVITIFSFRRDKKQYEYFKSLKNTDDRQKFFKKWTIEPFFLYGIMSIVILLLIGQINSLKVMPEFLVDFADSIPLKGDENNDSFLSGVLRGITLSIVPLLVLGSIIGTYIKEYKGFKDRKLTVSQPAESDFRNLDSLIPRNYKERIWGAILSINAGFSEELFFRVLAPILIYSCSGSALIAIAASTIWFALGHYYQGVAGMIATFFVGMVLFSVYLITQNIWITIIVHAILDINGLVLSPWLKERFARHLKR